MVGFDSLLEARADSALEGTRRELLDSDQVALRLYDILEHVKHVESAKITTKDGLELIKLDLNTLARDILKERYVDATV